jgi:prolyl oligopeptidase
MNSDSLQYPESARGDVVDDYHGHQVADPYRWLEDSDSEQTRTWIEAQNALTFGVLESIPSRAPIQARLKTLWDYAKYSPPVRKGERLFFTKNDGLQNQAVLHWQDGRDGESKVLLDPNTLSDDGTVSLQVSALSDDGSLLAYGLSTAGSDWIEFRVRDVLSGEDRSDHLKWVKFSSAAWTRDGAGFYYSRYAEPDPDAPAEEALYYQKLYYHRLGDEQSQDALVYERPDQKQWGFSGGVTHCGRYLVITVWEGTDPKNGVFVKDLESPGAEVVELLSDFDAAYHLVGNQGSVLWFRTDLEAPRGRLVAIDLESPGRDAWQELIPQHDDTLDSVALVGDRFLASYLHHASSKVRRHSLDGALEGELELPGIGTAAGFGGRREHSDTYFVFTSFTRPSTVYRYEVEANVAEVWRAPQVPFDPELYETRQVFVQSKDGTRVPLFLSHRKGLKPTGHPTYLYGYGGFNIPLTPVFSVSQLVWMELGGVFAVACLRGGGEYGEDWHQGGILGNKQNVFDDFAACAETLIEDGWTTPKTLAIGGGSNGGLLVGASLAQRPDLFAAALPAVGVMDMLRFHRFTIGWAWTSDYGCADEDEAQFKTLHAYSPLHSLVEGTSYPATLITTADHDDRVVPAHSFKFAAALQAAQGGPAPTLIRIEVKAGHGAGKPTSKVIEEAADRWAFLCDVLGVELPDSFGG